MTTDIFLVGLAGLLLIGGLINALLTRRRTDDEQRDDRDKTSSLARDSRS